MKKEDKNNQLQKPSELFKHVLLFKNKEGANLKPMACVFFKEGSQGEKLLKTGVSTVFFINETACILSMLLCIINQTGTKVYFLTISSVAILC